MDYPDLQQMRRQINLNSKCGFHFNRDSGTPIPKTTRTV